LEEKKCGKCRQIKPILDFHKSTRKDRINSDGYRAICKDCRNLHRAEQRQINKIAILKHEQTPEYKEKARACAIKRNYGITISDYNNLENAQHNLCAICQKPEKHKHKKRLSIDHCHKTKKVRGLLCHSCNIVLGLIKENLGILDSIKQYLKGD
jgi:hypothetical protein